MTDFQSNVQAEQSTPASRYDRGQSGLSTCLIGNLSGSLLSEVTDLHREISPTHTHIHTEYADADRENDMHIPRVRRIRIRVDVLLILLHG